MYQSAPGRIRTCDTRFRRLTEVAFGGAASGISAGHTLSVVVKLHAVWPLGAPQACHVVPAWEASPVMLRLLT